ncbi:MAG: TetR/AcrR family transcriptional regulator, partial [Desulfobulbaceae bacterium]
MNWKNGEYQPQQKRADEKKRLLMDTAVTQFSIHGYHGTTAKNIAREAGVATGSFYRYFKDKKAILMAVCHRMEQELGGSMFDFGRQMREEGHTEQEVLIALIKFAVAGHQRNKGFHREVLAMGIIDEDVAAWTRAREERVLTALLEFLKPMQSSYLVQDLEAAVELIYYTIEEFCHRAILFETPVGEERLTSELQEMLLRYLFK